MVHQEVTLTASASNIADLVRASAHRGPKHAALVDVTTANSYTWAEFDAAVDGEAHRLVRAGVEPGDRVVVRLPTGPEFCVAVFGVLRAANWPPLSASINTTLALVLPISITAIKRGAVMKNTQR